MDALPRLPAVLVVDDDPTVVILLHRVLRDLDIGHDIITTSDSCDVLAHLGDRPVPLVIADYSMPGMDGLQLTAAIKAHNSNTRVALITAYATPALAQQASAHYVDYYLPKPFALEAFEQMVQSALQSTT
jgi:two-component system, response regulator, stage 0 sporulation protein F